MRKHRQSTGFLRTRFDAMKLIKGKMPDETGHFLFDKKISVNEYQLNRRKR